MAYASEEKRKVWFTANKDRIKKQARERYHKNLASSRETQRKRNLKYYHDNKEREARYRLVKRQNRRKRILEAYGNKCVCCGEVESIFLALDHINNDGAAERKGNGGHADKIYLKVIRDGFPKDRYQLLCHNCNWAKSRGGCPHQKPS